MKISVENEWNKMEVLGEAVKRSYEKFRNVFTIEKDELNKKTQLLTKIITKIAVRSQYDKVLGRKKGEMRAKDYGKYNDQ